MKKIFMVYLLLFSLSAMASQIEVRIDGMVCSMCAQGIHKKLKSHPAVHHLNVNLDQKKVSIHTDDSKELSDREIKELIKEAGYNVASIQRK